MPYLLREIFDQSIVGAGILGDTLLAQPVDDAEPEPEPKPKPERSQAMPASRAPQRVPSPPAVRSAASRAVLHRGHSPYDVVYELDGTLYRRQVEFRASGADGHFHLVSETPIAESEVPADMLEIVGFSGAPYPDVPALDAFPLEPVALGNRVVLQVPLPEKLLLARRQAELLSIDDHERYNPHWHAQPRGPDGKWISGGGAGSAKAAAEVKANKQRIDDYLKAKKAVEDAIKAATEAAAGAAPGAAAAAGAARQEIKARQEAEARARAEAEARQREEAEARERAAAGAGKPQGPPLRSVLAIDKPNSKLGRQIQSVVDAIEKIHGVSSSMPRIPVQQTAGVRQQGAYWSDWGGHARKITVSTRGQIRHISTAHEIGHFVEKGGGLPGAPGGHRNWYADPLMAKFVEATENSNAIKSLQALQNERTIQVPIPNSPTGATQTYRIDQRHLGYLLKPVEIWARAYAQYVTVKSGHPELKKELDSMRDPTKNIYAQGWQWSDEDFKPIEKAMDEVFRKAGLTA